MAADRYEDEGLGSLRAPAHDVDALAAALANPRIGDFEVHRVFNQPAHEVNVAIEDFFADRKSGDVLLLYVSCHGVKDDAGHLYFATTNTRVNRLGSTGIASTFVRDLMTHSRSRNIILLLDCCYSGAFVDAMVRRGDVGVGINERLRGSGRAILSSSSALEYAFELDERRVTKEISHAGTGRERGGRPSIFTGALVEGLTTGDADQNRDGRISIDELYEYTFAMVTEANPNQTPTKFSDVSGELIVAYSPGTVRPPSLPDEVASAARSPLSDVRAATVGTLKELALAGDATGRLAYERLNDLLDDDSRTVIAKAGEAIAEIDRALPGTYTAAPARPAPPWPAQPSSAQPFPAQPVPPRSSSARSSSAQSSSARSAPPRPSSAQPAPPQPSTAEAVPAWQPPARPVPAPGTPLSSGPALGPPPGPGPAATPRYRSASPPWPSAPSPGGPPPPPWEPSAIPVTGVRGGQDESLRARSVLAYLLPFFTSLLFAFSRNRNVKFHAVHCALTDGLTVFSIIAGSMPLMLYSALKYGSEEIPQDDVPFNIYMVLAFLVVPLALRAYCLFQIVRTGTARIMFIGTLAHRIAYGGPGADRARSTRRGG